MFITYAGNKKSHLFFVIFLFCLSGRMAAQQEDAINSEILENFFRDNEQASESDAQLLLESLEILRNRRADLNTISREELYGIHVLNQLQLEAFFAYRDQFGPFLSDEELQAVPRLDVSDIRRLLVYTRVGEGLDQRNSRIIKGFTRGDNELLMRYGNLATRANTSQWEGAPGNLAVRYRHGFDNRLRFGFTAEKDAGEAFFRGSNAHGFDFYSGHIFVQNWNKTLRAVAIGDYSARFGQGLLLQTGFAPGKSAETVAIARGGRRINAYSAFGEAFFFRGAATTLALSKHLEITLLYSSRRRDGNVLQPDTIDQDISEIAFTSLQSSGLHRTPSEIQDEKSIRENVGGVNFNYNFKNGHFGINGLSVHYDRPWMPSAAAYRRFVFQGSTLNAVSADYQWRRRNWFFFGETARSDNGAVAAVNGILFSPEQHVTLSALHRHLPADYQSIYGNPVAEVTGAANEQGLYLGADVRWVRRWQLNVYADVWRHPWLRFGVSSPSEGHEYLARLIWTKNKRFSAYALFQRETKQRDSEADWLPGLVNQQRDRFRLHATYRVSAALECRSRIEWTRIAATDNGNTRGFLAYQEAVVKPIGFPVSGTLRYGVFDTDNFDTRVFAYENDIFSAISIPAFAGRGTRYYLNLQWRAAKWLRFEGRVEQTILNVAVTDSATVGRLTSWKILARVRW
jgi:hypothetical protein